MNRLLSALVNGAALGVPLTAAVWLLLRIVPRRLLNAATRYAVWWAALAVALALPAVYLPMPKLHRAAPPAAVPYRPTPPPATNALPLTIRLLPIAPAVPQRAPIFPIRIGASGWPRWLLALWALASACLLFRLVLSCFDPRPAARRGGARFGLRRGAAGAGRRCRHPIAPGVPRRRGALRLRRAAPRPLPHCGTAFVGSQQSAMGG